MQMVLVSASASSPNFSADDASLVSQDGDVDLVASHSSHMNIWMEKFMVKSAGRLRSIYFMIFINCCVLFSTRLIKLSEIY